MWGEGRDILRRFGKVWEGREGWGKYDKKEKVGENMRRKRRLGKE